MTRMNRSGGDHPLVQVKARFPARPEGLEELHAAFDTFFAQSERAGRDTLSADRVAILTAAGELAANIVEHACGHLPDAQMSLVLARHSDRIEVAFEDPGTPYEGPSEPEPEYFIPQGGRGLMLIEASVDALEYVRAGGKNRWKIVLTTN